MDSPVFIVVIISVFVGFVLYGIFFSRQAIIKRKLKKANTKRIADFKNGEIAKIVGIVEFVDPPLIAPLSGRECSHYHILIEQNVGKNSWKTLIEKEVSNKFVIRDENSCAFISNSNLKSFVVQDREYASGFQNDATMKLKNYLKLHGHDSEGILGFNKTIRYKEGVLERAETVSVYGKGEWKEASQLGFPDHYEKILVMSSPDGESVYMSDDPDTVERTVKENNTRKQVERKQGGRYLK